MHTSGKWKVIPPIRGYVASVAIEKVVTIADILETDGNGDPQDNARLIAAAPELLAFIKSLPIPVPDKRDWAFIQGEALDLIARSEERFITQESGA